MEKPNVNNLNGVPNFGHGFSKGSLENPFTEAEMRELVGDAEVDRLKAEEGSIPTDTEPGSIDEVAAPAETEEEVKPRGKKK